MLFKHIFSFFMIINMILSPVGHYILLTFTLFRSNELRGKAYSCFSSEIIVFGFSALKI